LSMHPMRRRDYRARPPQYIDLAGQTPRDAHGAQQLLCRKYFGQQWHLQDRPQLLTLRQICLDPHRGIAYFIWLRTF